LILRVEKTIIIMFLPLVFIFVGRMMIVIS
jgi:hypothetical protein